MQAVQTPYLIGKGKYQKIYNLALHGDAGERDVAKRLLEKRGLLLDKAGILWSTEEVSNFREETINYLFK